jgi:hypothetical protein
MPKLLFDLRNVPDDEADEVRALLDAHSLDFYETKPAAWGLFAGGLWITDDARLAEAKALFATYQLQRQSMARAEYAAARREGRAETLWSGMRREPGKVLALFFAIVFLVGLTVLPFILLGNASSAH